MERSLPTRGRRRTLALGLGLLIASLPAFAQYHHGRGGGGGRFAQFRSARPAQMRYQNGERNQPAPIERRQAPMAQMRAQQPAPIERRTAPLGRGPKGEHLAQWMNQHSGLSPQQQQQALEREPGFRDLPPQTQQHMRNRLAQLDAMSPVERQRVLAHTEWMEHLTLQQRAEVRGPMEQLGSLPEDQRRAVARSFRELRDLPPDQRMAAMNSERYSWMNGNQRATLTNLLRIEPLLPPPGR